MSGEKFYIKRGSKYIPYNDPYAYDGLHNGTWLVVIDKGVSCRSLIKPKCMELEAALHFLQEGLCRALSEKSKMRPKQVKMSKKEQKAWKIFEKTMGKDMPQYFEYASFSEIADAGCDYLRKVILENKFDIVKISEKMQNVDIDSVNPIRDLEV